MGTGEFNAEVNHAMASRFMPTETRISLGVVSYLARLQTLIIQFATQTHPNKGFLSSAELAGQRITLLTYS